MALDFLILYEHVVREYESILLLKAELARRGYTVELRQLLDRKKLKYFTLKKPKVLVSSCMYDDEAINSHVYNNIGVCNKVVNLHWEQMLSDTQEEGAWFNFGGNAKKCVQTCWGKRTQQRLVAHGMQEKNCPVTGAVMMDFLRPEFRGYFKDKAALCREHGLDPDKKLMLYISSFGYASMTEQEVKELSDMAGEDFTGFAGTNRASMDRRWPGSTNIWPGHPEVELVYRRHPSEWNSPALEALAKKRPNFRVIFADSVKQWIVAADQIFIWMSTAIAEVYFAGKSCRILRPVPIEHEYDPVIYKGADHITDYAAFAADGGRAARASRLSSRLFPCPLPPKRCSSSKAISTGEAIRPPTCAWRICWRRRRFTAKIFCSTRQAPALQRPPFRPHFNLLKFCALIGGHAHDVRGEIPSHHP
ncbi:MAG: surface carbohydrate biosynthesis protein [Ruthenibacterium lactatiformans]